MNLRLRFQNKTILLAMITAAIAFVYQILGLLSIVPPVSEDQVTQLVGIVINILVGIGVLVDPTTQGIGDSERAMGYAMPNKPELDYDYWEDDEDLDDDDEEDGEEDA